MTKKEIDEFYKSIGATKLPHFRYSAEVKYSYRISFDEDINLVVRQDLILPTGEELSFMGNILPEVYQFRILEVISPREFIIAPYNIEWDLKPLDKLFSFYVFRNFTEGTKEIKDIMKESIDSKQEEKASIYEPELSGFCISPEDEKRISYSSTENLTDDQLKKEYRRLNKEVLIEMIINQSRIISMLIEPQMKKYEMELTKNSSSTYATTKEM